MSSTKEQSIIGNGYESFYQTLLFLYPEEFRKKYGEQMFYAFLDLYHEEWEKYGKIRWQFGLSLFLDTMRSLFTQHKAVVAKRGVRKYFHISYYNIFGGILLLPFFTLFLIDFLGRVVQGDLAHYNRAWNSLISRSFFYDTYFGHFQLLWLFLVVFPLLAILLNGIALITLLKEKKRVTLVSLFLRSPLTVLIIGGGFFFLAVVIGHDVIPCTVHGLFSHGVGQLGKIISVCRNA